MLLAASASAGWADVTEVPLVNASFDEGLEEAGVPVGWHGYAGGGENQELRLVEVEETGGRALVIDDGDPNAELGVFQDFPAAGGETYRITVRVRKVGAASPAGAYLQLRFSPVERLCFCLLPSRLLQYHTL